MQNIYMDDEEILRRGGTEDDIREHAKQNGADLTREDVENEDEIAYAEERERERADSRNAPSEGFDSH